MTRSTSRLPLIVFFSAVCSVVMLNVVTAENKDDRARLLATRECSGCDLTGTNLSPYDLHGVKVQAALLSDAILYRSNLAGADLTGFPFATYHF